MVMNDNYEAIDPLRRHKYVWGSSRMLGDVFSEETNQDKIRTKGTFTLISIRSLHCKWHTQKKSSKKRIEQTQACVVSPSAVNLTDTIGAAIHITPAADAFDKGTVKVMGVAWCLLLDFLLFLLSSLSSRAIYSGRDRRYFQRAASLATVQFGFSRERCEAVPSNLCRRNLAGMTVHICEKFTAT